MNELKICSPWVTYAHQIEAMFGEDSDIQIAYDEEAHKITMYVKGTDKADALTELLPAEKDFGGVIVRTDIIPANGTDRAALIENALKGNPVFSYMLRLDIPGSSNTFNYAVFKKRVAQYWNDNLGDPHGNVSCLYQDLARDIFGEGEGVMYCTSNFDYAAHK